MRRPAVLLSAVTIAACERQPVQPLVDALEPSPAIVVGDEVYQVIDLGALEGTSRAYSVNDAGQVVGASGQRGFIWQDGVMTDLGDLGAGPTQAFAINEGGQVVGTSQSATPVFLRGFHWEDGVITDLGSLGGEFTQAFAINDPGQVVGYSGTSIGRTHAFIWDSGAMTDLDPGGPSSQAYAINDAGQVVGVRGLSGFIWQDGVMTDLGTLGGDFSAATAINESGQVVGFSRTAAGEIHAFIWQDDVMTDLGTLGGQLTQAWAINEAGSVAGFGTTATGEHRAFVWQDGVMIDLGTLGRSPAQALAINEAGQVVGFSRTRNSETHAFVWQAGEMTDLGTLGGELSAAGELIMSPGPSFNAINEAGHVVGRAALESGLEHAVLWRPLQGEQVVAALGEAVRVLLASGSIPEGSAAGLLNRLKVITALLNDGRLQAAARQLEAFETTVEQLVAAGEVPSAQGGSLAELARAAIGQLGG